MITIIARVICTSNHMTLRAILGKNSPIGLFSQNCPKKLCNSWLIACTQLKFIKRRQNIFCFVLKVIFKRLFFLSYDNNRMLLYPIETKTNQNKTFEYLK